MRLVPPAAAATLLLAVGTPLLAQQPTRFGPSILTTPAGTRAAAMGDAAMGTRDAEALLHDPAQLPYARGAGASWHRMDAASMLAVVASLPAGGFSAGVAAQQLTSGEASGTTLVAGVARVVKGVRVGVAGRYAEERTAATRFRSHTADVGLGRAVGPLQVGLAVQHLGATLRDGDARVRPPTRALLGFNGEGLPVGPFDFSGGSAIGVRRDGRVLVRSGWELGWVWIEGHALQGRVGVRRPEYDGQSPVTLGAGLARDAYALDYAYEPARASHGTPAVHRVGVRVR